MSLTLYRTLRSPPAQAVTLLADILGLNLAETNVDFVKREHFSPDYLKMNPLHSVPLLKDGDFILADSHAIMAYLVTVYGKDDSLYPRDPKQRALVDARMHFDTGIAFARLRAVAVEFIYKGATVLDDNLVQAILESYDFAEAFLKKTSFIAGETFTIADVSLYSTFACGRGVVPYHSTTHPKLTAWFDSIAEKPFAQKLESRNKLLAEIIKTKLQK